MPSACVALPKPVLPDAVPGVQAGDCQMGLYENSCECEDQWKSWTHLNSHSLRYFGGLLSGLQDSDLGLIKPIPFALYFAVITSVIELIDF